MSLNIFKYGLILLALLIAPWGASGIEEHKDSWFCKVIGIQDQKHIMYVSTIWLDSYPNHYTDREKSFSNYLNKITDGKFRPSYRVTCRDYGKGKRAEKHRKLEISTAKKYGFTVLSIPWAWNPKENQ